MGHQSSRPYGVKGVCHARAGKAKYDSKKHALVWKIKKFTGATEHSLVSAVELIATTREKKSWSRPPISMTFQVGPACLLKGAMHKTSPDTMLSAFICTLEELRCCQEAALDCVHALDG